MMFMISYMINSIVSISIIIIMNVMSVDSISISRSMSLTTHQRGVQWKQGVVMFTMLWAVLLYNATPIHCTPLRLQPPCDEYPVLYYYIYIIYYCYYCYYCNFHIYIYYNIGT